MSSGRWRLASVLLLAAGVAGCRRSDGIHTYTVPKEAPPAATTAAGALTDGMPAGLPPGHPPIDMPAGGPAGQPPAAAVALRYTAPEGWDELPAGGMRKAAFQIADGQQQALVTVIDFPTAAGPAITDPLANVNRWRREVALAPLTADALPAAVETLAVGDQQGTYVALLPDVANAKPADPPRGTLAAMVVNGDRIWFFKLTGDRDLVAAQQEPFRSFLESVRFFADNGADDGN